MPRMHPDTLFNQLGYARRSTGTEVAKAFGFITVGVLAGAAAAVLLTPRTGRQVRAEIKSSAESLKDRVVEKGAEIKNGAAREAHV